MVSDIKSYIVDLMFILLTKKNNLRLDIIEQWAFDFKIHEGFFIIKKKGGSESHNTKNSDGKHSTTITYFIHRPKKKNGNE